MADLYNMKKIKEIGIGILGHGSMGKSHSNAYKKMSYIFWPPPAVPKLVSICGRNENKVAEAAYRYGFPPYYTNWKTKGG